MRNVLVVCTGNICRSPVLERLLARDLADRGVEVSVSSAGTHAVDRGPDEHTRAAAEMAGLDLAGHRGRMLTGPMIDAEGADLVIGLTRAHARHVVSNRPDAGPRTGTVRELARLLAEAEAEPVAPAWEQLFADRPPAALLEDDPRLDVPDPYGRPALEHVTTVHDLAHLSRVVADGLAAIPPRMT